MIAKSIVSNNKSLPNVISNNSGYSFYSGVSFDGEKRFPRNMDKKAEARIVKLLNDYVRFAETDESFNKKFAGVMAKYDTKKEVSVIPDWLRRIFDSFKLTDDEKAMDFYSYKTTGVFKSEVSKELSDLKKSSKHLDILVDDDF